MQQGLIFNIQRFSTHDGPGIRTTIFFKGCPLDCWWCHNPEGLSADAELVVAREKCISCGSCKAVCPSAAEGGICILCGNCVDVCPPEARQIFGKSMTVDHLMEEIEKDRIFYDKSGGGVTFSGGEPLLQPGFLFELLRACREAGIHTAVDTSGHAPWYVLQQAAALCDLILYDIKHMNAEQHEKHTGFSNDLILANLEKLSLEHKTIWLRVPVIPGINDDEHNIAETAELALSLGIERLHLLPYHHTGSSKHQTLGNCYQLPDMQAPSENLMETLRTICAQAGVTAIIGG